ncbi:branched-chain amino acid ABC transporter permease [Pseudomonas sp. 5P_5.1_Bac1]|uniref:branched-chain amino acid ABC transporter permease n=1 Tax=Pseudomonas sp. 5P_5.1_Bac1 TaxID=2971616 RepID=UPI0021C77EC9|nr:branched-chain amino acid ABC transporter permease [Pseudomonas sp. 5P_5.1_Bac1]MCU1723781.1 branched-chain amino acid ABC transporter permease [Pseudomonas sp. 5P_5.1_Bac1]
MDLSILAFLGQDGLTTGAIYALVALALVLVFSVTRTILVFQGDFVTYSALTLATLQLGLLPGTLWLLIGLSLLACTLDAAIAMRHGHYRRLPGLALRYLSVPALLWLVLGNLDLAALPGVVQIVVTLALVTPLGPLLYRLVYQRVAETSVLLLLIISVAVHIALVGISLWMFGAEGVRTQALTDASFMLGDLPVSLQSLLVIACALALIGLLYAFFGHSLYGKALRATALNRNGAQLVGIPTQLAGQSAFGLAAFIGAVSGVLIGPLTTLYYDSGFLISLKGFVAAIFGGLASYPIAACSAFFVGVLESFANFGASAFKEVIVFTLVIPVLLWLSLKHPHLEEQH